LSEFESPGVASEQPKGLPSAYESLTSASASPPLWEQDPLERDMHIGRQIQEGFLPLELPQIPGWEIAARFQPARQVSGDFYDAFPLSNNRRIGFVIADVCDKGVGAAIFMALVRTLIRAYAQQHYQSSWVDVLAKDTQPAPAGGRLRPTPPSVGTLALENAVSLTNNYIVQNHGHTAMFATLFFGVLDPATGALSYVNCGHNPPILIGVNGKHERLTAKNVPLGLVPDYDFKIQRTRLERGDVMLAYTDGVTEAQNGQSQQFSEERLQSLLGEPASSAGELLDRIERELHRYVGDTAPFDDITMLAVRRV
jgi:sigma-B regulation protein RsbU (phosphoserine phosphatase)